jgi:ATP-binding cassette subfamily B multidrug efflux pump
MFAALFRWLESRVDILAPFDGREQPPSNVWRFMWSQVRDMKLWLGLIIISGLCFSLIEASLYLMVGWFVDLLAVSTPETLWRDHGWQLMAVAVLILVVRPLVYFINHAIVDQVVVPPMTNRIRWRGHVYVLGHAISTFNNDFAGRIATRVMQSGQAVRGVVIELIDDLWYVLVFAGVAFGFFAQTSLWLALPVALWFVFYVALLAYFVPRASKRSEINSRARSKAVGRVVDAYTNALTVKLFARADAEHGQVAAALQEGNRTFFHMLRLITGVTVVLNIVNSILIVTTAALCLHFWSVGQMTPGAIAAAIGVVLRLVQMSGWVTHLIRGIFENVGTVQESLDTISKPHLLTDRADAGPLIVTQGAIRLEQVRFNYGKGPGLFEGLDLDIRPGEKIGLVGPSGAGKSTLVSLLLRLHDVEAGRILIDGQDIAQVTQDSLRAQIGVVTQDTSLLHRSIRDNIAYGRAGATQGEIEAAAAQAKADGFIPMLADQDGRTGYDSRVGERGVKLSGGQRQRIAIARVILKAAPILILDEATSALDSESEAAIQEQLTGLMQGRTVIAVAHRLSTIAALDRIIVMDKGCIVDSGTHAELVARSGLYARLWNRQSGGFIAVDDAIAAA